MWALRLAELVVDGRGARLVNERTLRPRGDPNTFYESHGFSPDGQTLIFSASIGRAHPFDRPPSARDGFGADPEHAEHNPRAHRRREYRAGTDVPTRPRIHRPPQKRKRKQLRTEHEHSPSRARERDRRPQDERQHAAESPAFARDPLCENQRDGQREEQLQESSGMIPIDEWAEGDLRRVHFADPEEPSGAGEFLNQADEREENAQEHEHDERARQSARAAKQLPR